MLLIHTEISVLHESNSIIKPCFIILDSGWTNQTDYRDLHNLIIRCLNAIKKTSCTFTPENFPLFQPKTPRQTTGWDCGFCMALLTQDFLSSTHTFVPGEVEISFDMSGKTVRKWIDKIIKELGVVEPETIWKEKY